MTDALHVYNEKKQSIARVQDNRNLIIYGEHRDSGIDNLVVAETLKMMMAKDALLNTAAAKHLLVRASSLNWGSTFAMLRL